MSNEAANEALRHGDAEDLYENAPCGFLSTSRDGTILTANQTFLTQTGYCREDLIGRRTFLDLLTAGGRIYHETHYVPLLEMQGHVREIALDIVRADGTRLPALVNSVLEAAEDGSPTRVRTAIFDATERRQYERELVRARARAEESEARARVLTQTVQQVLIPPLPPSIPGVEVAAVYRPAGDGDEVGGDFYDVFELADGSWMLVIGDVCGKGVEAAVISALARFTIRAVAVREPRPAKILAALNEVLLRHDSDRFCTVALVSLQRRTDGWRAVVSVGGHLLPVRQRAGSAAVSVGQHGPLVGALVGAAYNETTVKLRPDDALVLFTDGVTEGRRGDELFGDQAALDAIDRHGGSASTIANGLLDEVLSFQSGHTSDDIAVLAVKPSPVAG